MEFLNLHLKASHSRQFYLGIQSCKVRRGDLARLLRNEAGWTNSGKRVDVNPLLFKKQQTLAVIFEKLFKKFNWKVSTSFERLGTTKWSRIQITDLNLLILLKVHR